MIVVAACRNLLGLRREGGREGGGREGGGGKGGREGREGGKGKRGREGGKEREVKRDSYCFQGKNTFLKY